MYRIATILFVGLISAILTTSALAQPKLELINRPLPESDHSSATIFSEPIEITDTCRLVHSYESSGGWWELPGLGFGEEYFFVQFNTTSACSLAAARFRIIGQGTEGEPTVRVQVFGTDFIERDGLKYPSTNDSPYGGANWIGSVDIPYDSLVFWPEWNVVDLRQLGPYPLDSGETFFLTLGMTPGSIEENKSLALSGEGNISYDSVQFCRTGYFRHIGDSTVFQYISEITQDGALAEYIEIGLGAYVCSGAACYCTYSADLDRSHFIDAIDMNAIIDMVYFNGEYPPEPLCAWHPGDITLDGAVDATDVYLMIAYVFLGGTKPELPCSGP